MKRKIHPVPLLYLEAIWQSIVEPHLAVFAAMARWGTGSLGSESDRRTKESRGRMRSCLEGGGNNIKFIISK